MKNHLLSRRSLLGALALVALPTAASLPGCGGGNGDYSVGTFSSNVTLSSVQTALLVVNTGGGGANGFLYVNTPGAALTGSKGTRTFGFVVAKGNYPFTGTFSPPARFSVVGQFSATVPFTIVGQVPANGGTGIYTITANGQTATGILQVGAGAATPAPTTTNPTGTTAPTATPTTPPR